MNIKLKHLVEEVDRHGNPRIYVRIKGRPKIRIRAMPGTPEFMVAYQAAMVQPPSVDDGKRHHSPAKGTFGHVCLAYYASPTFKALDAKTQRWRRRALDLICEQHGDKPVAMQPKHIRTLRDEKATPVLANERLRALRALYQWAVEAELAPNDPTRDVRVLKYVSEGHHTWTLVELEQYEQYYPIGTKERLALALMLYTAGRREDAIRLGPKHLHDGRLQYVQAKNEHRKLNPMDIPVHADLAKIIFATPTGLSTFLVNEHGNPFTVDHINKTFHKWCAKAGLPPHCTPHGVRKATATYLAQQGCTDHEIMAITGHETLEQVKNYTRKVERSKLADSAMAKFKR
jgi:integrase/recombinase XerD